MTCAVCHYEFCWLCLANWKEIVMQPVTGGRITYNMQAHKEGCWFREQGYDAVSRYPEWR